MKAVVFDRFGDPAEVLQVREVPMPEPAGGQVRVRMIASPINPSDLMTVRGQYGRLPKLPGTPGFEGAGVVDVVGSGLLGRLRRLKPGKRVAVLNATGGNWQEYVVVPVKQVVPVPADLPDEQVASFFVNPASALLVVRYVLRVPPGAWLLQTAAGSELGKMVIRLGKHFGFRTLNVVRRREQAEELLRAGGDAAISTNEESLEERVQTITGGAGVGFAIDAVGGATGSAVVRALGEGGRMLVYGTLAGEPLTVDPRILIAGQKRVEGFWLSIWARSHNPLTMLNLFRQITSLIRAGVLITEIGGKFPLNDIGAAVKEAERPGRPGKVLLQIA